MGVVAGFAESELQFEGVAPAAASITTAGGCCFEKGYFDWGFLCVLSSSGQFGNPHHGQYHFLRFGASPIDHHLLQEPQLKCLIFSLKYFPRLIINILPLMLW